ncbi:MAG TPA: hypothetical protein VM802_01980 [Chitinophaga sp.]|uniref:hypothetical protein n=1 Tax=Chitinophaga sp. TaxID=1869181 RepID=UPI002C46C79A|nr:hypothetical protein [Chitinophaga sp.]HVI43602.1 hypothetical protein [Chitinophaga sp.]
MRKLMSTVVLTALLLAKHHYSSGQVVREVNGNVGIGVPNPLFQLVLPNDKYITWKNPDNSNEDVGIKTNASNDLTVYAFGSNRFYVQSKTGYIGLGNSAPKGYLHISALATAGVSSLRFGMPNDAGNLNVPTGAATGAYDIDFHNWRDNVPDQVGARIRAERVNSWMSGNALLQSMDLVFYTSRGEWQSDLTERIRIKGNGDVAIGTSNPQGYKLAVAGSMIAERVRVKLQGAWPDFVFHHNYQLPSLQDVEKFIQENRHLPDIPSATEVEKNGMDVGEINRKLLQKVEELTLYIIEMKKEIEHLKQGTADKATPGK